MLESGLKRSLRIDFTIHRNKKFNRVVKQLDWKTIRFVITDKRISWETPHLIFHAYQSRFSYTSFNLTTASIVDELTTMCERFVVLYWNLKTKQITWCFCCLVIYQNLICNNNLLNDRLWFMVGNWTWVNKILWQRYLQQILLA